MSSTLASIKAKAKSRENAEKKKQDRLRAVLVLCLDYLTRHGYINTAQKLQEESGVTAAKWEVADNIDLNHILMEFEEYYKIKFARLPKFYRKAAPTETKSQLRALRARQNRVAAELRRESSLPPLGRRKSSSRYAGMDHYAANAGVSEPQYPGGARSNYDVGYGDVASEGNPSDRSDKRPTKGGRYARRGSAKSGKQNSTGKNKRSGGKGKERDHNNNSKPSSSQNTTSSKTINPSQNEDSDLSLNGQSAQRNSKRKKGENSRSTLASRESSRDTKAKGGGGGGGGQITNPYKKHEETPVERPLLKPLPHYESSELRQLAAVITMDIYRSNPNVRWDDIAELHTAKQLLKEAVVMPLKYPQLFTGLLAPWKGVLLYGPPGTGKTMLARAVATECKTTFFNISASSIVSKWRGDSEKLVRMLFELARYHAPSTIFIDELDSIMGERGTSNSEHEGSRRMKTELLIQMDGLSKGEEMVFVLAASNLPWALDPAMLRRLEKRILVPLPNAKARRVMIEKNLPEGDRAHELDYDDLAKRTENYSGSDIVLMCKEAAMRPMRALMKRLEKIDSSLYDVGHSSTAENGSNDEDDVDENQEIKLDPVTQGDINMALDCTKPSTKLSHLSKYEEWHAKHGSGVSETTNGNRKKEEKEEDKKKKKGLAQPEGKSSS